MPAPRRPATGAWLRRLAFAVLATRRPSGGDPFAAADAEQAQNMSCKGGERGICRCLLSDKALSADPDECDAVKDPMTYAEDTVVAAMTRPDSQCANMKPVVECSKKLGCLSPSVRQRCLKVKSENEGCELNCHEEPGEADERSEPREGGFGTRPPRRPPSCLLPTAVIATCTKAPSLPGFCASLVQDGNSHW
ncbi:unnamed protein product [Prorocentrum cordatum]|uniref:Uncharacterized protein n=1 Tax=Prorocentrum cordatum TaxID=2364126 RepID=A0ABN9XB63_9DINO|nr:unnamed protein product [Polarella glacialis]